MRVLYNDFERKVKVELLTSANRIDNESIVRILLAHTDLIRASAVVIVEKGRWQDSDTWFSPSSQYHVQMMREDVLAPDEASPSIKGYINMDKGIKEVKETKRTKTKK
jgi:hypothetical protein